jgi:hypothetical protein
MGSLCPPNHPDRARFSHPRRIDAGHHSMLLLPLFVILANLLRMVPTGLKEAIRLGAGGGGGGGVAGGVESGAQASTGAQRKQRLAQDVFAD